MITVLLVALGASIAAPLRYAVERGFTVRYPHASLPIGLLVINVFGSALAGIASVLDDGWLRVALVIGFCGTLTTFSGFGWYVHRQWQAAPRRVWFTIATMTLLSTAGFWSGLEIGELFM